METLISELCCSKDIHYKTAKYNFTKRRIQYKLELNVKIPRTIISRKGYVS